MTAPAGQSADLHSGLGSATWLAEKTVIGVLLWNPQRSQRLTPWLGSSDFATPLHQEFYTAITDLHARGDLHPITAGYGGLSGLNLDIREDALANLRAVQHAVGEHATGDGVSHGTLIDLCAAGTEVSDGQLVQFGRMVLEMSVRRQVTAWGVQLVHASSTMDVVDRLDTRPLQQTRDSMLDTLSDLQLQIRRSYNDTVRRLERTSVGAPHLAPVAELPPVLIERSQRQVIQAVIADTRWLYLLDRFRPEDFVGSPTHANTWRAMQTAASQGLIHPVTVAWEAETQLPATMSPSLTAADLSTMAAEPVTDVSRAVSTVAGAALAEHARQAHQQLHEAAANRSVGVADTVDRASHVATTLVGEATRLTRGATEQRRVPSLSAQLDDPGPVAAPPTGVPPARTRNR